MDTFGHLEAIGAPLPRGLCWTKRESSLTKGLSIDGDFVKAAGCRYWEREPKLRTLLDVLAERGATHSKNGPARLRTGV